MNIVLRCLLAALFIPSALFGQPCVRYVLAEEAMVSPGPLQPAAVVNGDLNRDTRPDLIVAASNGAAFLLARADGTFAAPVVIGPANPSGVAYGDFTRDGYADIAAGYEGAGDNVLLFEGNARGNFLLRSKVAVGTGITAIAAADVDRDNDTDLAVAELGGKAIVVLKNLGTGDFTVSQTIPISGATKLLQVIFRDLNGDQVPDLTTADNSRRGATILNNGTGTFGSPRVIEVLGTFQHLDSVAAGDIDADGDADLVFAGAFSLWTYRNGGNGNFGPREQLRLTASPYLVALGDLDGRGIPELFVADDTSGVSLFWGTAGGELDPEGTVRAVQQVAGLSVRDFNHDDRNDLAVVSPGAVHLYRGRCATRSRPVRR